MELPGGMIITVSDDKLLVEAGKTKLTVNVDGAVTVESEADVKFQAKGDITMSASNIKMKSDMSFEIKAGTTADIESSAMMTIKGMTVSIN